MLDVQCTPPSSYGSFPIWQVALTMMLDVQCDDAEELKEWEEEDDDEVHCHVDVVVVVGGGGRRRGARSPNLSSVDSTILS